MNSVFNLIFQYVIPCFIVFFAYYRVYSKFKETTARAMKMKEGVPAGKLLRSLRRRRRTNIILVLISIVFFLSWAPLNLFSIFYKFFDFKLVSIFYPSILILCSNKCCLFRKIQILFFCLVCVTWWE